MVDLVTPNVLPNPVTPLGWDGEDFHAFGVDTNGVLYALVGRDNGNWLPLRTDAAGHLEVDVGHDDAGYAPLKAMDVAGETYQVLANTVTDRVLTAITVGYAALVGAHVETERYRYTVPVGHYGVLAMHSSWITVPTDGYAYDQITVSGQNHLWHMNRPAGTCSEETAHHQPNIYLPTGTIITGRTRHTSTANVWMRLSTLIHIFAAI